MKYAIYDMTLNAPAFDFVQFCIVAKSKCAAMGEECYIVFKMGPNKGFKEPNDKPYTGDSQYIEEAVKDRPGSVENWTKYGFPPGSQLPWHTKNQKIIWEDDTFENLRDAYEEWLNE